MRRLIDGLCAEAETKETLLFPHLGHLLRRHHYRYHHFLLSFLLSHRICHRLRCFTIVINASTQDTWPKATV
jgi:hypothetical protein